MPSKSFAENHHAQNETDQPIVCQRRGQTAPEDHVVGEIVDGMIQDEAMYLTLGLVSGMLFTCRMRFRDGRIGSLVDTLTTRLKETRIVDVSSSRVSKRSAVGH